MVGQWVCEHRDPSIRVMVGFRRVVAGTEIADWWDDGANAIAFSRGDKGFVAINREPASVTASVASSLAPGVYCDLLTGGRGPAGCAGTGVVVGPSGALQLQLKAMSAVAIDVASRQ
jgi:alpha-amylase